MAFSLSKVLGVFGSGGNKRPDSTVGIDIGSASVKVIELEATEKALQLRTYGELQLGPYDGKPLGETVVLENKKRIEAVVDVMREAEVHAAHGALAMPLSSSFMTVVPIVLSGDENIENRIPVEARKYVPLPLTDVALDWSELPPSGKENEKIKEVMLAAIENKALAEYRELLNAVRMTGEPAEIEAFSLVRALWRRGDTTLAIIDIGARTSKLYIVRDGVLERLHRVASGGAQITRRLAELLNISFEDAENLKRAGATNGEHQRERYQAMVSVVEGPLLEFKRIINQYEARIGSPIGRVAFSGGVTASEQFLSYGRDAIGLPAEIGNPFSKVAYPAFMEDTLKNIAPTFAVSMGAALRLFQ